MSHVVWDNRMEQCRNRGLPPYALGITFDFTSGKNEMTVHLDTSETWKVAIVDTGLNTLTGGRVKRVKDYINNELFMLTYGEGVSDINIAELVKFYQLHGKAIAISAYNVRQRFGVLDINAGGDINEFREKIQGDGNLINAGFMVCQSEFLAYVDGVYPSGKGTFGKGCQGWSADDL